MAYGESGKVDETKLHQLISRFVMNSKTQNLMAAYERRHRTSFAKITTAEFPCHTCFRLRASRLGLQSHQRTHR